MKTFSLNKHKAIYFYGEPVRMNASFDKLAKLAAADNKKPMAGDAFLFVNKAQTYIKVLYHSKNGYCIYAKRLDPRCKFDVPAAGGITVKTMLEVIEQVSVPGKTKLRRAA